MHELTSGITVGLRLVIGQRLRFLCMLPIAVARSSSGGVAQSQWEGEIWGVFFLIDNALHSIAFGGIHAKTAEQIEIPFGLMTRAGLGTICVRWGPDPQGYSQLTLTITSMLVLLIVHPKCTLAVSHAATW